MPVKPLEVAWHVLTSATPLFIHPFQFSETYVTLTETAFKSVSISTKSSYVTL